jgi:hypothetical protein
VDEEFSIQTCSRGKSSIQQGMDGAGKDKKEPAHAGFCFEEECPGGISAVQPSIPPELL